jgi:hypothetical protein
MSLRKCGIDLIFTSKKIFFLFFGKKIVPQKLDRLLSLLSPLNKIASFLVTKINKMLMLNLNQPISTVKQILTERSIDTIRWVEITYKATNEVTELVEFLQTFQIAPGVTGLTIYVVDNNSGIDVNKAIRDELIRLIDDGPSDIVISSWPAYEEDYDFWDTLANKMDLKSISFFNLFNSTNARCIATLARQVEELTLGFRGSAYHDDWFCLGDAIAASTTLKKLYLTGYIPLMLPLNNLPVHLKEFQMEQDGEDGPDYTWLTSAYWPKDIERMYVLSGSNEPLPPLDEQLLSRLSGLEELSWYNSTNHVTQVLSRPNNLKQVWIHHEQPGVSIQGLLRAPYTTNLRDLEVTMSMSREERAEVCRLVRTKTNINWFSLQDLDNDEELLLGRWFAVMTTLFSIRSVPRLRSSQGVGQLPFEDLMPRIIETLGWPLHNAIV